MAKLVKKDLRAELPILEGVQISLEHDEIIAKKDGKEVRRKIDSLLDVKIEDGNIVIETKKAKKEQKRKFGTLRGHIKNMMEGLTQGFEYELEIANVHFPMTVEYDSNKKTFTIKNMLGEKSPRTLKIKEDVEVQIKAPKIHIKSYSIEAAGNVASLLEKVSKVRNRDRNKFQDGIFITKKPRMDYL